MLTVNNFCRELASALVSADHDRLPLDGADVAVAMESITQEMLSAAKKAFDQGQDELGDDLLRILDEISPSPTTGAFDNFWRSLRALQPGFAGINNPLYADLRFKPTVTWGQSDIEDSASEIWRDLITSSSQHFIQRL